MPPTQQCHAPSAVVVAIGVVVAPAVMVMTVEVVATFVVVVVVVVLVVVVVRFRVVIVAGEVDTNFIKYPIINNLFRHQSLIGKSSQPII